MKKATLSLLLILIFTTQTQAMTKIEKCPNWFKCLVTKLIPKVLVPVVKGK